MNIPTIAYIKRRLYLSFKIKNFLFFEKEIITVVKKNIAEKKGADGRKNIPNLKKNLSWNL